MFIFLYFSKEILCASYFTRKLRLTPGVSCSENIDCPRIILGQSLAISVMLNIFS